MCRRNLLRRARYLPAINLGIYYVFYDNSQDLTSTAETEGLRLYVFTYICDICDPLDLHTCATTRQATLLL